MTFVLHYGVVEEILNFAVIEYLSPLFLLAITKKPALVVLQLEDNDAHLGSHNHIHLNLGTVTTAKVEVVVDVLGRNSTLTKF